MDIITILEALVCCAVLFFVCRLWLNAASLNKRCNELPTFAKWSVIGYIQLYNQLKTAKGVPPLCAFYLFLCSLAVQFEREGLCVFWFLFRPMVFIYKAEFMKIILNNPATMDKVKEYSLGYDWFRTGLVTSKGEKWRNRRKLLNPAFHRRILRDSMQIINKHSLTMVDILKRMDSTQPFDIANVIALCTLDILCEAELDTDVKAQEGSIDAERYLEAGEELTYIVIYRLTRPWLWYNPIFNFTTEAGKQKKLVKVAHGFTRKVIEEKLKYLRCKMENSEENDDIKDDEEKKGKAAYEILLEQHIKDPTFSLDDVLEELDTIIFAGHDTTKMALCVAIYLLGLHPDVQENTIMEIDSIFGDDTTKPITYDDLSKMEYLECVIKESMRLYPPVPITFREVTEDVQLGKYTLPPGAGCGLLVHMLHRDPSIFPNPEKFDPGRFSPENIQNRHPYAFIPFLAGPRNCIGHRFALMEMKVMLGYILRHFKIESMNQRDETHFMVYITLRNVNPIMIRLSKRH